MRPDQAAAQTRSLSETSGHAPQSSTTTKYELDESSLRDHKQTLWRQWGLEIAMLALSCLSLSALVVVLYYFDGQPQKQRILGRLTLNGLVAFLSTVTRAAMLFAVAIGISQSKWNWFYSDREKCGRR